VLAVCGIVLPSIQQQSSHGDTRILKVVVNGGVPIELGASDSANFSFSITAEDPSGIRSVDQIGLWSNNYGILVPSATSCQAVSRTTSVCTGTSSVSIPKHQIFDDMAGHWFVQATANANDGDKRTEDEAGKFSVLKMSRLTVFGGPTQTVARGQSISISGLLEKPDWRTQTMVGNPSQNVSLQFCANGCAKPVTVATVRSDSGGNLLATVRASSSGTYTWVYPGSFWASSVSSVPTPVTVGS
jgi:hypothetical protein